MGGRSLLVHYTHRLVPDAESRRYPRWVTLPKSMCVQQQLHVLPVQNSSGNGLSKSSLVQIAPGCNPATRGVVGEAIGMKRAIGVLPSVRTISVPSSTRDNNSFKASVLHSRQPFSSTLLVLPIPDLLWRRTKAEILPQHHLCYTNIIRQKSLSVNPKASLKKQAPATSSRRGGLRRTINLTRQPFSGIHRV